MNLKHRVIFADSRDLESLLLQKSVDLVLTGPPYWNEVTYSNDEQQLSRIEDYTNFLDEISKVWSGCSFVLKDGGIMAMWLHDLIRKTDGSYKYIPFHSDILKTVPSNLILRNIYIWDRYLNKYRGEINDLRFGTRMQYVLIFQKQGLHKNDKQIGRSLRELYWQPIWHKKTTARLLGSNLLFRLLFNLTKPFCKYRGLSSKLNKLKIITDKYEFNNYITECPEDISDLLINLFSSPGDMILDPFVGSGTTLKSALKYGRNSIGIDINKNCEGPIRHKLGNKATFK